MLLSCMVFVFHSHLYLTIPSHTEIYMGYLAGVSRGFLDVSGVGAVIKSRAVCQSRGPGLLFVSSYDVVRRITIRRSVASGPIRWAVGPMRRGMVNAAYSTYIVYYIL